jgi:tetratricopeptide (TPR) repeat protein
MLTTAKWERTVSDYCHRGDFEQAASVLEGWRGIGIKPYRNGQSNEKYAEDLQWAAVISVELSLAKQISIGDAARDMLTESADLSNSQTPLVWLGVCYYRCGEYGEAGAVLASCLEHPLDNETRFLALRNLAVVRTYQGHLDHALSLLTDAEHLLSSAPPVGQGKLYLQRGLIYRQLKRPDDAIAEYERAGRCFEQACSRRYEAAVSINMAGVFLDVKDYLRAHVSAERAASLLNSIGDKLHAAKAWDQIARIYLAEDQLDSAERAARHAIALVENGDQGQVLAECLITHGVILGKRGVAQSAQALMRAAGICSHLGDHRQAREANEELARIVKESKSLSTMIAEVIRPLEHRMIKDSLTRHKGVISRVAVELEIPYETLIKKIKNQFPDLMDERRPVVKRRKSVLRAKSHNSPRRED